MRLKVARKQILKLLIVCEKLSLCNDAYTCTFVRLSEALKPVKLDAYVMLNDNVMEQIRLKSKAAKPGKSRLFQVQNTSSAKQCHHTCTP